MSNGNSDLYGIAEIFCFFGGSPADKAHMLRVFSELCRSLHISQRQYVTKVMLMVRMGIGELHDVGFLDFYYLRGSFGLISGHFKSPMFPGVRHDRYTTIWLHKI
jgi:hypothetical protein